MNVQFPYQIDPSGVTSRAGDDRHILDLIEQVLFTSPGERVNRPTFGTGLLNMVFAPGSDEIASATQYLVQGALQQTLGDKILVQSVAASFTDGALMVTVQYVTRVNGQSATAVLTRQIG